MLSPKTTSLLVRLVYAVLIILAAVRGDHDAVFFHALVFLGTVVVWFVRDERALYYDALLIALFAATLGAGSMGYLLKSSVLGLDKLFHFLAGVALTGILLAALPRGSLHRRDWLLAVFMLAFVLFAAWEVYEWFMFELIQGKNIITLTDTWLDFVADGLGAAVVLWFTKR